MKDFFLIRVRQMNRRDFFKGAASAAATATCSPLTKVGALLETTAARSMAILGSRASAAMFATLAPFAEMVTTAEAAAARSEPLRLVNVNTNEAYDLELFMGGQWNPNAIMVCDFLMRDWRQNQTVACDRRIYAGLYVIQHFFGKDQRIKIHSGFRTTATNMILKEQGYAPAVNSQHLLAKAVDFSLPGASVADIAKVAWASKSGGVGCYKKMGFVHWDFRGEQVKWGDSFL